MIPMIQKTAADLLRDKYMASQLKKSTLEKIHPDLSEVYGIEYLRDEISSKLYNPLFNYDKFKAMGCTPPKSVLLRGISGVGKTFLINCFCQNYQIPLITNFIESNKDLKDLFSRSKTLEKSLILIENIDYITKEDNMLNLLNELIRKTEWNTQVVITNTNTIDNLNYDNEIFIKIPSLFERRDILYGMLRNIRKDDLDLLQAAQNTPGFVPRDLDKLIKMCCTTAIKRNPAEGILKMDDFVHCINNWKNINTILTFDDIGALNLVKDELTMSILMPSRYPEKFAAFGIKKPSGVLLYGPPGCGKTLIAKAVSNMSYCNFLSIKGPELITKYVGDSEKHLRDLFQKAKNLSPCVLFFDEIDSLCGKRGKNEFGNRIVNQILTLLDGMEDRGEVYLIGATNRLDSLDEALMRPGRFDKVVEVPLPSTTEALEIFKKCISTVPHDPINWETLNFEGFSGADIAGVTKEAALMCLKNNFEVENLKIHPEYFIEAIEKLRRMKMKRKETPKKRI